MLHAVVLIVQSFTSAAHAQLNHDAVLMSAVLRIWLPMHIQSWPNAVLGLKQALHAGAAGELQCSRWSVWPGQQ